MSKRKRSGITDVTSSRPPKLRWVSPASEDYIYAQIVTGSYERVLHGITVTIPRSLVKIRTETPRSEQSELSNDTVSFTDSFLLNAHASAIKCLAVSPTPSPYASSQKVILATGSSDEKINLFHLSTRMPRGPVLPALGTKVQENASNRSLGTLHTHNASITALCFPNRSKLMSSCGNNIIAVTSTRTFNTLSLIKAPSPKHPNRPTGDTSTTSTLPNGINDFAVHSSMKLMISVGRAERSMRLWNLVTGRKAGVLSFDKQTLSAVGEGSARWGSGEGQKVSWSPDDKEFAICFQKGICVFGIDSEPIAVALPTPSTKLHQARYLPSREAQVLVVSTEDGRLLFYSSDTLPSKVLFEENEKTKRASSIPECKLLGQMGGRAAGIVGRIKDFHILRITEGFEDDPEKFLITTTESNGCIRVWWLDIAQLIPEVDTKGHETGGDIGILLGSYETGHRVTCVVSFPLVRQAVESQDAEATTNGNASNEDDEDDEDDSEDGSEASDEELAEDASENDPEQSEESDE